MIIIHLQVNSQWRKVQDRLEDDERCLRVEKLDRLLIFQVDHIIYVQSCVRRLVVFMYQNYMMFFVVVAGLYSRP